MNPTPVLYFRLPGTAAVPHDDFLCVRAADFESLDAELPAIFVCGLLPTLARGVLLSRAALAPERAALCTETPWPFALLIEGGMDAEMALQAILAERSGL
jgi:hypothetical protein